MDEEEIKKNKEDMDPHLAEAITQIQRAESLQLPPVQQPQPQIVIQAAPGPVAPVAETGSRLWLYIVLAFVFLLLTYMSVQYAKDVRSRDTRNKRYNLEAYVDYGQALANRLPKGHLGRNPPSTIEEEESEPNDDDAEDSDEDDYVKET